MAPKPRKRIRQKDTGKGDSDNSQNGKAKKGDRGEASGSSSGILTKLIVVLVVAAIVGFAAAVHLGYINIKQLQELNGGIDPEAKSSQSQKPVDTEAKEKDDGGRVKRDKPEPIKETPKESKKKEEKIAKSSKEPDVKKEKVPEPKKEKAPESKTTKTPEPKKEVPTEKKEKAQEPKKEKAPEPKKEKTPEPKKEKAPEPKKEKAPEPKKEKAPEPKKEKPPVPKKEKSPEPKKEKVPEQKKEKLPASKKEKAPEHKKEKPPEPKKDKAAEQKEKSNINEKRIPEPTRQAKMEKEKTLEPEKEKVPEAKHEKAPQAKKEKAPEPKKEKQPEPKKEKPAEPKKDKTPEARRDKAPEPEKEKATESKKEKTEPKKEKAQEPKKESDVNQGEKSKNKKSRREEVIVEGRTNAYDKNIEKELDIAEDLLSQKKLESSLRRFENLLTAHPASPRARLGRANALNALAEQQRSNDLLNACITAYDEAAKAPNCPKEVLREALVSQADRLKFQGNSVKAVSVLEDLNKKIPNDVRILRELGVAHLIRGSNDNAKPIFQKILQLSPKDGHAKVHLGFIVKSENKYEESIPLLKEGIATGEEGTQEGKYYFHLGDALYRLGKKDEAYEIYNEAANKGFFLSKWQRSLYNVDSLTSKPWWTPESAQISQYAKLLEDNWKVIRDEGLANLDAKTGSFVPEVENLRESGDWKQFTLYQRGKKNDANCKKTPKTCKILDQIPMATSNKRGQIKYSVLQPETHIWPHCGPTNCRLRSHLGLVVPEGVRIRVKDDIRTWHEGKLMIFDDSFEHEVWHEGSSLRLVLIVDFWHPELTDIQKRKLTAI